MKQPRFFLLLSLNLLANFLAFGQWTDFQKHVDEYISRYVKNGDFSGNLLVAKGETILFNRSYGKADYALGTPMQKDHRFRIASLSKTFTAAAIIMLNNGKAISLSDKLSKYIPGFQNGDSITILHLLLHQSGVADIDYDRFALDKLALQEAIATIKDKPLYFKPGTQSRYSNSGYLLLAAIVEKASGIPYAQFLQECIFSKLGMKNTGVDQPGKIIPNKATGYSAGTGAKGIELASWYDINLETGSGSLYSTVDDLLKWLKAIKNNTLFDISALPYPFGWGTREYFPGKKSMEQSGFLSGYASYAALYPSENLFVIGLSNISSNFNEQSGKDIAAIYFKSKYELPELRKDVPVGNLSKYTGKYSWPGYKDFVIEKKNDAIYWRFTDEKTGLPLAPVATNSFLLRTMNSKIIFDEGPSGTINSLSFQSGNDKTVCKKIEGIEK